MNILSRFGKPMKEFGVGDIGPISLALGTGALVLAVVVMILATVKSNVTDGNATAVLNKIITALATLADWYPNGFYANYKRTIQGNYCGRGRRGYHTRPDSLLRSENRSGRVCLIELPT